MMGENQDKQMEHLSTRTLALMLIVFTSLTGIVRALETTDISISPEPVGSGARALGQSAFIAVADDATAASWNPAGLINLERAEASFIYARKINSIDLTSSTPTPYSYSEDTWALGEINFMSYAQPVQLSGKRDVVLSVNYHQVYDLGLEFNRQNVNLDARGDLVVNRIDKIRAEGAISACSVAGGVSIPDYPEITVGASFNWYTESLCNSYVWKVKSTTYTPSWNQTSVGTETLDDFRGHNFTVGLLWDAYEKQQKLLTLGLVYHTPFTARVKQEVDFPNLSDADHMDIDFPLSLGAGVNYRFRDDLNAAFDVQWTDWSEFTYTENRWSLDDDAIAYRLGGEYLFIDDPREPVLAFRGGVFYEPRPAWDKIVPIYGLSVGLGLTVKEKFSLDFAYQYRWGEKDIDDFYYETKEQFFVTSVIFYL